MDRMRLKAAAVVAALAGTGLLAGCGDAPAARPLTADSFTNKPARDVGNPVDRPGALMYDTIHQPLLPPPRQPSEPVRDISAAVRTNVRSPVESAGQTAGPTTMPSAAATTQPSAVALPPVRSATAPTTGPTPGTYITLGAVLVDVNSRPIFTDKVLREIELPLSVEAKKLDPRSFAQTATNLLADQIGLHIRDELEFASAQRALEPQDEQIARGVTMQWRQKEITAAGGSLELARQRWAAQGWDFEERVEQQFHTHMSQLYYQKHIVPLIQVTAADIRNYYYANRSTEEFTKHGAAKFRVIKIDPRNYVGLKDEAYNKAQSIRQRAAKGEDFGTLATTMNDDRGLAVTGGYIVPNGWVSQGAFAVEAVDKAVFEKMHPGEVSDIITGPDSTMYVVKLEEIKPGAVRPFTDFDVQQEIQDKLKSQQFAVLRNKHVEELKKEAVIRPEEWYNTETFRDALQSILRRYPQWAAAK
jgi:hypothetical protein